MHKVLFFTNTIFGTWIELEWKFQLKLCYHQNMEVKEMSSLNCKAKHCCYNDHEMCKKSEIHVGGKHACESDETCCDSFSENCNTEFASDLCPEPGTMSISCDAENCTYNSNRRCTSKHVDIQGKNADLPSETACATFRER